MGKSEVEKLAEDYKDQLNIGIILYALNGEFTAAEIKDRINSPVISRERIHYLLLDLVSRGIVEPLLSDGQLRFHITAFGRYFFSTLSNSDELIQTKIDEMERCSQ